MTTIEEQKKIHQNWIMDNPRADHRKTYKVLQHIRNLIKLGSSVLEKEHLEELKPPEPDVLGSLLRQEEKKTKITSSCTWG